MLFADVHYKTGVDLDMMMEQVFHIAALAEGQAAVHQHEGEDRVLIMNGLGQVIRHFHVGPDMSGFRVQGSEGFESLIVYFLNGTMVEMQSPDGRILNVYNTGIKNTLNRGSPNTDICYIPKDIILFTNYSHVFSYNISSQTQKVNLKGMNKVYSVTCGCMNGSMVYVVSDIGTHKVHVYNSTWSLIKSFGGLGSGDGQFDKPYSAAMSDQGQIFVADFDNYRVSMFASDGQFVKHIINHGHPYRPWIISVRGRYLWVTSHAGPDPVRRVTRYILF